MYSRYYHDLQFNEFVFKSVVWKKGDESFPKMPFGLGVGSNPGPLASE